MPFKGQYWLKNFVIDADLPPLFNEGYWKLEALLYQNNQQIWGLRVYFKMESSKVLGR